MRGTLRPRRNKQHRHIEAEVEAKVEAKNKVLQQFKDLREKCHNQPSEQCKQVPRQACWTELKSHAIRC